MNLKLDKLFFIILFSVFLFTTLKAEIVNKINITGNQSVSDETVKIYGEIYINKKKDYSAKDLDKILLNLYSTNFFKDIKVNINNGVLNIFLKEYPVINELIITGETRDRIVEDIKKIITLKQKSSFIENNLAKDVKTIKSLYSSIGFNFAKIETKIRKIDERKIDLIFEISKGNETRISKIRFIGDKKIKEKRLRDVIASEEDKFWKFITRNTKFSQQRIDLDLRLLKNYYRSLGYYYVDINANSAKVDDESNVELTYSINAGKRYRIKKITTNTDPVFNKELFFPLNDEYQKIIGTYHSPFKIKKLLESIDEIIANNNLQFVEHRVEENVEGDQINIKFDIYEGEKVLVERINILGNNVTNEAVVRSELILDEGDPFTNLSLDKSISKIRSRNIFGKVDKKISNGSAPSLKIIDITVEEKPTGEISAGAGAGTNGASFAFNIKENNWLGEGKRVSFDTLITSESLRGTLNYTNPNYDFMGNSINYFLSSQTNDKPEQGFENTLTRLGINTSFEQYKDVIASLGFEASHDDLRTQSNASSSLKKQSGTFNEVAANYGFSLDKRNRAFMPTDGSIIGFNQSFPVYADKSFISNTLFASKYKTINENVIGAAKFYFDAVNGINNEDVRLSKRNYLSTRRLRGFESGKVGPVDGSDHVGGNYVASLNFEANLPNFLPESTKTDIGLFLDFGNVWGVDYDDTIDESNKIRSSTGVAASWLSPLGPMSFILSTNISKASTDVTESFNFNLGTTF